MAAARQAVSGGGLPARLGEIEAVFGTVPPELVERANEANPWRQVCDYWLSLYAMVRHFGRLPRAGGLDDQDWLTLWALGVIAGEVTRCESEQVAAAAAKSRG